MDGGAPLRGAAGVGCSRPADGTAGASPVGTAPLLEAGQGTARRESRQAQRTAQAREGPARRSSPGSTPPMTLDRATARRFVPAPLVHSGVFRYRWRRTKHPEDTCDSRPGPFPSAIWVRRPLGGRRPSFVAGPMPHQPQPLAATAAAANCGDRRSACAAAKRRPPDRPERGPNPRFPAVQPPIPGLRRPLGGDGANNQKVPPPPMGSGPRGPGSAPASRPDDLARRSAPDGWRPGEAVANRSPPVR